MSSTPKLARPCGSPCSKGIALRALDRIVPSVLVLAALSCLPSCGAVAPAPSAAAAAFVDGDLEAKLGATPGRVIEASEAAFREMNIPVKSKETTGIDGKLIGRTALDKKVEITVQRETDTTSQISIRIDTFGDESFSRQILEKIRAKL